MSGVAVDGIVRLWSNIHPMGRTTHVACQFKTGNFGWAKVVGVTHEDGSTDRGGWNKDQVIKLYQRFFNHKKDAHKQDELWPLFERTAALVPNWWAPGWDYWPNDPSETVNSPPVDRCPHDGTKQIRDFAELWDPWVIKGGQRIQRFTAPLHEQMDATQQRLVARALRSLPEVPLCNVSGERVDVIAKFDYKRDMYYATFRCGACGGAR